jgi:hypothetical protein
LPQTEPLIDGVKYPFFLQLAAARDIETRPISADGKRHSLGKHACEAPEGRVSPEKRPYRAAEMLGFSGKCGCQARQISVFPGKRVFMPTYNPANSDAARLSNLETI